MTQPQPQPRPQPKRPPFWEGFTLPSFRFPRWPAKKRFQKRAPTGYELALADTHIDFWNEKVPVVLMMASQALLVSRWYISIDADALMWVKTLFSILIIIVGGVAGVALDLAMVSTLISSRNGRRGPWGALTAAAATTFSGLITLEVAGAWEPNPYLHAAYAVVTFLFMMHLASPRLNLLNRPLLQQRRMLISKLVRLLRQSSAWLEESKQRLAQVRTLLAQREHELAQVRIQLAQREHELAQHDATAAHAESDSSFLRTLLAQREQELAQLRTELVHERGSAAHAGSDLAHLRAQLAHSQQETAQLRTELAQQRGSVAHVGTDLAHLRTALAQREQELAQAQARAAQREQELAQARAAAAQHEREMADLLHTLPSSDELDLTAIAQRLKEGGTSWREIELLLRVPQSTLRNRLKAVSNGHLNGVAT